MRLVGYVFLSDQFGSVWRPGTVSVDWMKLEVQVQIR